MKIFFLLITNKIIMKSFNKNQLIQVISIIVITFFISCSKERTEDKVTATSYAPMDAFYNNNAPPEQTFTIDSLGGDTVKGMNGTKIWGIPKVIFMYKSTLKDIIYPYTLKLIEAYSMKNMILERLPNVAQNQILQSAGELKVTAFKDTNTLLLKKNCGIQMWSPSSTTAPDASMKVYYGFTKGSSNDWNMDATQTDFLFSPDTVTKLSISGSGYSTKITKLGWVSINHTFSNSSSNITFSVSVTTTNTNYIDIYVIFKNRHSFIKVSSFAANNLPTGEPITVLALANDNNGQMYYFKQDYAISNGLQVTINMTSSTVSQILTLMGTL